MHKRIPTYILPFANVQTKGYLRTYLHQQNVLYEQKGTCKLPLANVCTKGFIDASNSKRFCMNKRVTYVHTYIGKKYCMQKRGTYIPPLSKKFGCIKCSYNSRTFYSLLLCLFFAKYCQTISVPVRQNRHLQMFWRLVLICFFNFKFQ